MPEQPSLDAPACALIFKALELKSFFSKFGPAEAAKLFPNSKLETSAHNARLIEEGQKGRDLFVVIAGKISIYRSTDDGSPEFLATLGPGKVFGEIGLLDGVRVASAVSTGDSTVFRLAHEDVERLLDHEPRLAAHLKALANERLGES